MLDEKELAKLVSRCRAVPLTENEYVATDFVVALLETVMDYQNATTTVHRAGTYFVDNRWDQIRTLDDLERVLARFPADKQGNDALAQYLWGYHHWRRAQELRGLVAYFRERNVTDLSGLRAWAVTSTTEDFVGRIKGLGTAVYHGLVMRLGVETVKPDVHILRFVAGAIGRPVNELEAIEALEEVARQLDLSPRTLDWSIWEYQRALPVGRRRGIPRRTSSKSA
jgi:hypothetical protein